MNLTFVFSSGKIFSSENEQGYALVIDVEKLGNLFSK